MPKSRSDLGQFVIHRSRPCQTGPRKSHPAGTYPPTPMVRRGSIPSIASAWSPQTRVSVKWKAGSAQRKWKPKQRSPQTGCNPMDRPTKAYLGPRRSQSSAQPYIGTAPAPDFRCWPHCSANFRPSHKPHKTKTR